MAAPYHWRFFFFVCSLPLQPQYFFLLKLPSHNERRGVVVSNPVSYLNVEPETCSPVPFSFSGLLGK
jgi:hypothetical protein